MFSQQKLITLTSNTLLPSNLKVTGNIKGNKAELLLNIINDKSLLHYINRPKRNQLFEIIGQCFPSQIDSLHSIIQCEVLKHRGGMCEWKPTIHHKAALSSGYKTFRPSTSLIEMNQRGWVSHIKGLKVEIFKHKLIHGTLNGGKGEEGFC